MRSGICTVVLLCASALFAANDAVGVFRFPSVLKTFPADDFNLLLKERLENESALSGFAVKSLNVVFESDSGKAVFDREKLKLAVYGIFALDSSIMEPRLSITVFDKDRNVSQEKSIYLAGMTKYDLLDIVILKIGDFFETSLLGKLTVSSTPLECNVSVNGTRRGVTPVEFIMRAGEYSIEINEAYLLPYAQKVAILPGKTVDINAKMVFDSLPTGKWFKTSAVLTGLAIASIAAQSYFHTEYTDVPRFSPQEKFESSYSNYKISNALAISIVGTAILSWGGTGYCYFWNLSKIGQIFKIGK